MLMRLRRMLVRLGGMVVRGRVVVLAVLFRRRAMRLRGVLVMLGCFRVGLFLACVPPVSVFSGRDGNKKHAAARSSGCLLLPPVAPDG